jgi:hypothetical protein
MAPAAPPPPPGRDETYVLLHHIEGEWQSPGDIFRGSDAKVEAEQKAQDLCDKRCLANDIRDDHVDWSELESVLDGDEGILVVRVREELIP